MEMEMEKKFDLAEVLEITRQAEQIGLKFFGRAEAERKSDNTLVTDADRRIEEMVRNRLEALTPEYGFLGEESGLSKTVPSNAPYWVLDPLDGTGAFVSGLPCWSFSLGLVSRGKPVFGVVNLPMMQEMYYTGIDGRAYRNDELYPAANPRKIDTQSVLYVTASEIYRGYRLSFPGKFRTLGSAAYHGLLTARPYTAGVLQGPVYLWDLAAVLALNEAWGLRVATLDGRGFSISELDEGYRISEPLLFAHPELFEQVAATIEKT